MGKYKFSDECEDRMYNIIALRDILRHDIKAGDWGGLVSGKHNLSQEGDCWIKRYAHVCDNARVRDNARVSNNARVWGNAIISDNAIIRDGARVRDNAHVCDNARVRDNAHVCDNARVRDNAHVCDNAYVRGYGWYTTTITGNAVINGNAYLESGTWETTPKVIYGSMYDSMYNSMYDVIYNDEQIAIDCECHPLRWWKEHGLALAKKDNFTPDEIEEYREYLNTIKKECADG